MNKTKKVYTVSNNQCIPVGLHTGRALTVSGGGASSGEFFLGGGKKFKRKKKEKKIFRHSPRKFWSRHPPPKFGADTPPKIWSRHTPPPKIWSRHPPPKIWSRHPPPSKFEADTLRDQTHTPPPCGQNSWHTLLQRYYLGPTLFMAGNNQSLYIWRRLLDLRSMRPSKGLELPMEN